MRLRLQQGQLFGSGYGSDCGSDCGSNTYPLTKVQVKKIKNWYIFMRLCLL
jgi:hypothetical protein